jgi:hypothetical protein
MGSVNGALNVLCVMTQQPLTSSFRPNQRTERLAHSAEGSQHGRE